LRCMTMGRVAAALALGAVLAAGPGGLGQTRAAAAAGERVTAGAGTPPAFTSASSARFTRGLTGRFTVSAAGSPAPSLSESGTLPPGVTFHDNGNGTATLGGTPSVTSTVTYPLTLTASNGVPPNAVQHFTLTVADHAGYVLTDADGGAYPFGGVHYVGSLPGEGIHVSDVTGIAATLDGRGYWMVTASGHVYNFGDAHPYGSVTGIPIAGIAATPGDGGYWLVARDGDVFPFGNAKYFGSIPGLGVHVADVAGMAPTRDGRGYYITRGDGTVYGFGDALFAGGAVTAHFGSPVVAIASDRVTEGFWLLSANGGIYAYHAGYFGATSSAGAMIGIVPSPDDQGYLLADHAGRVYPHGDAHNVGSAPSSQITGIAAP
jgi:hypothetical protein